MTTPQFSGLPMQAHPLGEQQITLSGQSRGMAELSLPSADENSLSTLIERIADWVYYQNELEFE